MKLSKLYANQPEFKAIIFNNDFNVIFGDVSRISDDSGKVEEHNLGKTSLVHLINFMLLERLDQSSYLVAFQEKFLSWEFFLEVKLNDGTYVTIKRSVGEASRVSFKRHTVRDQDFVDEKEWDYQDLSIYAQKMEENAEYVFEHEYLKFNIHNDYGYRFFLGYVLRTQDDYLDVFRLNKFKGKDRFWKPQLFELLGFDAKLLDTKYDMEELIKDTNKVISNLTPVNEEDKYEIIAAIEAKQEERSEAQVNIDQFNFYTQDNEINQDLVKDVEQQISLLNEKKYNVTSEIEQIQQSLDSEQPQSLEVNDLEGFFEEIKVIFPDALKKEYSDVITFSRNLSEERQKYLRDELKEQQINLRKVNDELRKLNIQRAELLSMLTERDSFNKFKDYQNKLTEIDTQIFEFKQQLRDLERVQMLEDEQRQRQDNLNALVTLVDNAILDDPADFTKIKKMFMSIYKSVFEYTATLIVRLNKQKNVEFSPTVLSGSVGENLTGKSKGYTSRKIMCAAFILSVLTTYSDRSFIGFAYTDGILEGWGDSHKRSFIEILRTLTKEYDIQFIISLIKSDVPVGIKFEDREIVRKLSSNDTLFNVDF